MDDVPSPGLSPPQAISGLLPEPLDLWIDAGALVLLLSLIMFFSLFRYALAALSPADKLVVARLPPPSGPHLNRMVEREHEVRLTFVLINTLFRILFVVVGVSIFVRLASNTGWPDRWWLLGLAFGFSVLFFFFGELIPTWLGFGRSLHWSRLGARLAYPAFFVLLPLTSWICKRWPAVHESVLGLGPGMASIEDAAELEEEITALEEERELINTIVEYGKTTVGEIMVSRMDMIALSHRATLKETLTLISQSGHSRIPVYVDHLDSIPGILYAKDLLVVLDRYAPDDVPDWPSLCRSPHVTPVDVHIDDLLKSFQRRRTHMAIVVDEYGGTEGLVTIEDILEEIVGDIRDEYDVHEKPLYERIEDTLYRVDARIVLDELDDLLAPSIGEASMEELLGEGFEFETLGGLIFYLTESIPEPGTEVQYERLTLTVESVENHRIKSVLVRVRSDVQEVTPPETPADREP